MVLLLAALCVACSIAAHWYIRSFALAVIASTVTVVGLLQLVAYLYLGYVDAWADIAAVTTGLIALACSVVIGTIVRIGRAKWSQDRNAA
jgi:UDP-N-acetylmuramyl pentapeptide phosphotransferase/UDP-N-acetylglucosamine-1-phosphate transferase